MESTKVLRWSMLVYLWYHAIVLLTDKELTVILPVINVKQPRQPSARSFQALVIGREKCFDWILLRLPRQLLCIHLKPALL